MVFQMVEYLSKQQAVAHLFVCLPALGVLLNDEINSKLSVFVFQQITRFLRNKQTCGETMISSKKLGFETLLGITRLSCHGFSKSFILV